MTHEIYLNRRIDDLLFGDNGLKACLDVGLITSNEFCSCISSRIYDVLFLEYL